MKQGLYQFWLVGSLAFYWLCAASPAIAQLVPDTTLGAESSVVNPLDESSDRIDGGAMRGANLFHSFREFNIGEARGVYFANPAQIQNIFTRVTGNNLSNIDGTLGVLGNANLFLINPNGIIFGPNASLDVRGSFIASTANSVKFADGSSFSATNTNTTPLLTISVPVGLQYGVNPGQIVNQSKFTPPTSPGTSEPPPDSPPPSPDELTPPPDAPLPPTGVPEGFFPVVGLQVPIGKTLALVGGDVRIKGGTVIAERGRIELGAVGSNSLVSLTATDAGSITLGYEGVQNFQDIFLSQQATVDTSGEGGGTIQMQGRLLNLGGDSEIAADSFSSQDAGSIAIGGQQLIVRDGTVVSASAGSAGGAGTLTVNATDSVELIGVSSTTPSSLLSLTAGNNSASVGNITINTRRLIVRDGAAISTATAGQNRGGNLTVNASESVLITGTSKLSSLSSLLTETYGTGSAGDLTINTRALIVQNGAQITSSTFFGVMIPEYPTGTTPDSVGAIMMEEQANGLNSISSMTVSKNQGAGGNVNINAARVIVENSQIESLTEGLGRGGNLIVNATESVRVSGRTPDGSPSGLFASSQPAKAGAGNAGNAIVKTGQLIVENGGKISVSSLSSRGEEVVRDDSLKFGTAGNLEVNAGFILLDNGILEAQTVAGDRGNITIESRDMRLRNNSTINANATTRDATGSKITINTATLVGLENSDITSNALAQAGKIEITFEGIFGLERRSSTTPDNDITAVSETNLNGQIIFNAPDVDRTSALVNLENNPVNPDTLIARGCEANEGQNASWFINTNRGGLPANPGEPLSSVAVWEDLRPVAGRGASTSIAVTPTQPTKAPIREAQDWMWKPGFENRVVTLTANPPVAVSQYNSWQKPVGCNGK